MSSDDFNAGFTVAVFLGYNYNIEYSFWNTCMELD